MNDYSSLDELFDIYDEPATESLEMMAATTVARVGGAGIAHVVHTIDADKAGQLTNDELRELKEAAKWCRSKFKSMAPDIVKDRLNKGIVKLGKNDKILKSNIANFDFNASISDDKMRDEHWAPVVTATSDITNVNGGLTNYGYDFFKLIKGELEKKYPNCEMDSMEVGKYIYVLKYKKSKAAKEGVAMEGFFDLFKKKENPSNHKDYVEFVEAHVVTDDEKKELIDVAKLCINTITKNISRVVSKHGVDKMRSAFKPKMDTSTLDSGYITCMYINFWEYYSNLRHDIDKSESGMVPLMHAYLDLEKEVKITLSKSKYSGYTISNDGDWDEWVLSVYRNDCLPGWAKESAIGGDEKMNDLFEGLFEMSEDAYADTAFESIATNLRRDYQEDPEEPISLKSMYCVHMNDDALKKYQEEYDQLKKVDKNAEKLRGCMYFWQKELAAFISIDIRSDKVWIDTLEVVKKFRGKKLSFQLLDVAVRKFHATDLKVHIDNKKAIGIFKTYGFKTYDKKNNWLYMTLRDDVKDIDDKHTEDVKPVDKGTKTDDIQEAKEGAFGQFTSFDVARAKISTKKSQPTDVYQTTTPVTPEITQQLSDDWRYIKVYLDTLLQGCAYFISEEGDLAMHKGLDDAFLIEDTRSVTPNNIKSLSNWGDAAFFIAGFDSTYGRRVAGDKGETFGYMAWNSLVGLLEFGIDKVKKKYKSSKDPNWDKARLRVAKSASGNAWYAFLCWRIDSDQAKESAAMEAAFNNTEDSTKVEKLLASTEPTLRRQLKTIEDCDKYLEIIKNESTKFNEAANAIISAYSKYESGDKTKEDAKEFNKTVAAGKKLLNDNCRKLNVRLGKLVGDNDHISRQDVKNFAQYISGLRKIVNSIKRDLTKGK